MAVSTKQKVIFVVGPTASGKSSWALESARAHQGSIVNIDSVQFYEGLLVGSAAPSVEEKKQAPHYLYSYVKAPHEMTAGRFLQDFYDLVKKPEVKFPLFIVGGTGFYIQALEKGLYDVEPVPTSIKEKLESELAQTGGPEKLFDELKRHDPETKIHLNDHYRVVRALEIIRFTGKKPSALKEDQNQRKNEIPFDFIKVGFNFEKEIFLERVQRRTQQMISSGLIEETDFFLKKGFENWAPLASVGYKECVQFIQQNKTKDWLVEAVNQSTMQLIKKQKTWFKRDPSILWSDQASCLKQFLLED